MYTGKMEEYEAAEKYLLEVPKFTKKNPLEKTKGFYRFLQSNRSGINFAEEKLGTIIHVAGTNGKGSVCAFLESVCRESGYCVGMFTSPHLVTMRERFQINGEMISKEMFLQAFNQLNQALHCYQEIQKYQPTFFELLFFMMLLCFSKAGVEVTILETGMGGRLDATNAVENPALTVITQIGMDHMAYLGNTLEEIAGEKAGIIKEGIPVIYVDRKSEVSAVIEHKSRKKHAVCYKVSKKDYQIHENKKKYIDFSMVSRYYDYISLKLNTTAVYQAENAAVAISCLEVLQQQGKLGKITRDSLILGMEKMKWPGRMEEVSLNIYIDGAHNEDGMEAFVQSVSAQCRRNPDTKGILLFSVVNDKTYDKMIEQVTQLDCIDRYVITQIPGQRGTDTDKLKKLFEKYTNKPVYVSNRLEEAYEFAIRSRGEQDTLWIVGSLYLAGMVKDLIHG